MKKTKGKKHGNGEEIREEADDGKSEKAREHGGGAGEHQPPGGGLGRGYRDQSDWSRQDRTTGVGKVFVRSGGVYPATDATTAKPEEDSLEGTLMQRLGGPPRPEAAPEEDADEVPESAPVTATETVSPAPAPGSDTVEQKAENGE
jgi:hypothetical protein